MIKPEIEKYIKDHCSPEDEILAELNRETHLKAVYPRMLSGHILGKFLEMISLMIKPEKILEIGTFTGYSTICLANGLTSNGKIYTIDLNPEIEIISEKYFKKSGITEKIVKYTGNALDIIPTINEKFDLVFIDADKENYLNYYKLVIEKINPGGFILADNVLWDGKVLQESNKADKETQGIMQFNEFVQKDKRVENVLVPLRDGVMLIRKL